MPEPDIDAAREDENAARDALRQAWRGWAAVQGDHLRGKLLEEGKLTAVKQHAVTHENADSIPGLKVALAELAAHHGDKLTAWGENLTTLPEYRASEVWASAVEDARLEFGKLFHPLGYVMNDLNLSRDWAGSADWEFYEPATGTARTAYLQPEATIDLELERVGREFAAASARVKAAAKARGTDAASALWDAS
jgi:hypothetical protein